MIKNKTIRLLTVIIPVIMVIAALFLLFNRKYLLEVSASPSGSKITVNQNIISDTNFSQKLKPGVYLIVVTKGGYKTGVQEVALNKNIKIEINLDPTDTLNKEVNLFGKSAPFVAVNPILTDQNYLIAIDRKSDKLIKIEGTGRTVLYDKPVLRFSFTPPLVALIEKDDQSKIVIVNSENGTVKKLENKGVSQIIFASIGSDAKNIAFLGKYSPATRDSTLYLSDISNFAPRELLSTKSNEIVFINNDAIILFETKDALDLSEVSVRDILGNLKISPLKANFYLLSPSKKYLLTQSSTGTNIVDLGSYTKKAYSVTDDNKLTWLDDSTLISVKNLENGIEINSLAADSLKILKTFVFGKDSQTVIRSLLGVVNNNLFFVDIKGDINNIDISQVSPEF